MRGLSFVLFALALPAFAEPLPVGGLRDRVVINIPDDESDCNQRQKDKCDNACNRIRKLQVACEVRFDWNEDGTATRTVVCTCASPGLVAAIPVVPVDTEEIEVEDSCQLDPPCAVEGEL